MHGAIQSDVSQISRHGKTMLTFEFKVHKPFDAIMNLVPQNCLVNMKEIIPGLDTDVGRFPIPRANFNSPMSTDYVKMKHKRPLYLHNIELKQSSAFETQFENFLRNQVSIYNGELGQGVAPVMIEKRYINVGVSNAWRNLNSSSREKEVLLEDPDRNGSCYGAESICLENYIEDPLIALTFSIVFVATLPIRPVPKVVSHTVAWQVFLPGINSQGELQTQ